MKRNARRRGGMVLLIIVVLLVLLTVVAITFAIVAGHYKNAALAQARVERYETPPSELLDSAFYQLVRDTRNPHSVLRGHSLLRDMYAFSYPGLVASNPAPQAQGQFLDFQFDTGVQPATQVNGFLSGLVCTFLTGDAAGLSTRVVFNTFVAGNGGAFTQTLRIVTPKRDDGTVVMPRQGDAFLINGRPFVGTGAGYDPATGTVTQQALLPNRTQDGAQLSVAYAGDPATTGPALNEDYDAVDFQNMFLGAVITDRWNVDASAQAQVIPSFHRPALIRYWHERWKASDPDVVYFRTRAVRDMYRWIILRPMPWDHPNFTGSNPGLAPVWDPGPDGQLGTADDFLANGEDLVQGLIYPNEWRRSTDGVIAMADVDNDGDGVPDSYWLDLGFPVQTDREGRRYKPLFAILCVDLDGRLNLNAHGNLAHLGGLVPTDPAPVPVTLAGGTSSQVVPRGQGFGPAEINLGVLFSSVAEYHALLQGDLGVNQPGRYGNDPTLVRNVPGVLGLDPLAAWKFHQFPLGASTNYFLPATPLSAFQSPFDIRGNVALGLDYRGSVLFERPPQADVISDSAYEMRLDRSAPKGAFGNPTAVDTPFTVAELERILRAGDFDSQLLPERLWQLAPVFRNSRQARYLVTTDSFDVGSPVFYPGRELATWLRNFWINNGLPPKRPQHVTDLVLAALLRARGLPATPTEINELNRDLSLLLDVDSFLGLRLDINRPFGNGRDDNNNRVVDDPQEALGNEGLFGTWPVDVDNDGRVGPTDADAVLARQRLAKNLYVLLMALKDPNYQIDYDRDGNTSPRETAYAIAQWCINVVDFRDADSIMTPFEFDINPFNRPTAPGRGPLYGWDVDGVIGINPATGDSDDNHPERGLVWGCERPELLITEAVAFHDRRTENLDNPDGKADPADPNADEDFDQRLRPRGSFFVELYNPWAGDERAPAEFYYDFANNRWAPGVRLDQRAPGGAPVWRLVVVRDPGEARDPDHPFDPTRRLPPGAFQRSVFFTTPPAGGFPITGAEQPYWTTLPVAPILPGRYAVVGSSGQEVDHRGNPLDLDGDGIRDYVTTIGRRTDAIEDGNGGLRYDQTRRIVLEPSPDPNQHGAAVYDNQTSDPFPPNIQPAVGIAVNQPRSLNITEPNAGYPTYTPMAPGPNGEVWDPTLADYEGAYEPPLDEPLDKDPELVRNGTVPGYRVVHLQRLANPLAPYDPQANPYLTIDSMSVDLTSFNGVTSEPDPNAGNATPKFYTRERGYALGTIPGSPLRMLWKHEPIGPQRPDSVREPVPTHIFSYPLIHSMGFLNRDYQPFYTAGNRPVPDPVTGRPADWYVGAPDSTSAGGPPPSPPKPPFPWLTWWNRPFVSPHELLLVPRYHSSRLPLEYDFRSANSPYQDPNSPFPYLLSFFHYDGNPNQSGHFYRLLELVGVRSPFLGTETILNPDHFAATNNPNPGAMGFFVPFNRLSEYREPGRINLNTIFDRVVWNGLLAGHAGPSWSDFVSSRRGYGSSENQLEPNAQYPTYFGVPFRAPGAEQLAAANALQRDDVDYTLLRRRDPSASDPLFSNRFSEPFRDSRRNPYFYFQGISRLSNLVTTRSNVYAIWITVGYFEVEPVGPGYPEAYPDGFRLGQELGADTGEIRRHRAFYIVDRTIPVAFEPGQNHNVDRMVLLRRIIE